LVSPSNNEVNVDITFIFDGKRVEKQVTPGTRVSVIRSLAGRVFGIGVRRRRVVVFDGGDGEGADIEEGDGSRDIGWFISGRNGKIVIE